MLPPLYKFRSINEDDHEKCLTLDSLRESYVFFSNVTNLNDPFEMGAYLDQVSDPEVARSEFMTTDWTGSKIGPILAKMGEEERERYLAERWNCDEWRNPFLEAWKGVDGFADELKARTSIYCASATRTDGLLWAHYGAGHRGIAIELNPNADEVLRSSLEVSYEKEFPIIDMLKDDGPTKMRKALLTKSDDWRYEKEFRAIYPAENAGVRHEVSPSVFVSIIFGAKITDKAREMVIEATRPRLSHVRFQQARLGKKSFAVEFEAC